VIAIFALLRAVYITILDSRLLDSRQKHAVLRVMDRTAAVQNVK
jgi:uncharacterized membrane protein